MPSLKEDALRLRAKAGELWGRARTRWAEHPVTSKIWSKRPSRKALAWTGGTIGGVLVVLILILGLFDWNYLKGPVERIASSSTGRVVKIDGNLRVKILSWTPSATIEGLRISNPGWAAKEGEMTKIGKLSVSVKLLPLFKGQVILPTLKADNPDVVLLADGQGRNNWTFGNPNKNKKKKPFKLPPIQQFDINNGKLRISNAKRRLDFTGTVTSSETRGGSTVQAFSLLGDGTLNGAPFDMTVSGGPLLNIDPNKPYPFSADIRAGDTRAIARGSIRKPFDLGVFDTTLTVTGRDLADLYYLTGLALPNTPRYNISGTLTRRGMVYRYDRLQGKVGDSDMHGWASVEIADRPMLRADLHSNALHFDDLAAILGAKPKDMSVQEASAKGLAVGGGRLFPDTPLRVERLRSMDAKVKYRATSVVSSALPLRKAAVDLTLEQGLLTLDPVMFGLTQGQIAGKIAINARKDIPAVDLDVRLTGARMDQFIPARFTGAVSGALIGRAKLSGVGASVRDAAASANGQVTLVVPRGQIREAFAELLGVNVVKGIGLLFSDPKQQTELRCAVADFKATNGVLTAQTLIFDTEPVIATGGGTINLKDETLDLTIKGHPKEARLLRLSVPIEINGTLTKPQLRADPSTAVGQGGLAVVIGAALSPLAAVLPFIDLGEDKDANCPGLVGRAGTGRPAAAAPVSRRTASR